MGRGDAPARSRRSRAREVRGGERADLETFITRAADAAEMFAVEGIGKVMNTYSPDATEPGQRLTPCLLRRLEGTCERRP